MNCLRGSGLPETPGGVYFHLFHGVIDVVMIAVIISCNSLISFAIIRYNCKRKTTGLPSPPTGASLRLVLSLAMSDILVGLTTAYFLSFEYSCAVYTILGAHKISCVARFAIVMFATATSCFSLINLAIDRYVAIIHALRYRDIMTNRIANGLIVLAWLLGAVTGFLLVFWNNWTPTTPCIDFRVVPTHYVTILCTTTLVVVATILAGLHFSVHREALASNKLKRSMSLGCVQPSLGSAMKTKSARTIYLVLGCIIILWSPLTAIVIARSRGLESPNLDVAYRIAISLYNLGYFVNTFIYSWKNTTIRMAILQVFERSERRRQSTNSELKVKAKDNCVEENGSTVVVTSSVDCGLI